MFFKINLTYINHPQKWFVFKILILYVILILVSILFSFLPDFIKTYLPIIFISFSLFYIYFFVLSCMNSPTYIGKDIKFNGFLNILIRMNSLITDRFLFRNESINKLFFLFFN